MGHTFTFCCCLGLWPTLSIRSLERKTPQPHIISFAHMQFFIKKAFIIWIVNTCKRKKERKKLHHVNTINTKSLHGFSCWHNHLLHVWQKSPDSSHFHQLNWIPWNRRGNYTLVYCIHSPDTLSFSCLSCSHPSMPSLFPTLLFFVFVFNLL